jgi:hypothetical protein
MSIHRLINALQELEAAQQDAWATVIRATNDLVRNIAEESITPELMLELEKLIDAPALRTAWMYSRIESAIKSKRGTAQSIRRILGYDPQD